MRQRVKLRAQPRGDELDIDAVVRSTTERRSGHTPGQKVYQRIDHRERDVASLLLLDTSASTAQTAPSGGRTVLDLARDAALLTALTMERAGDRCAIHGFCSNGHHEIRRPTATCERYSATATSAFSIASKRCPRCCRLCTFG